jgi:hypothetical protein
MKKILFTLFSFAISFIYSYAQPAWTIAKCTNLGSTTYGPMYSTSTANANNRTAVIYPSSQLTALAGSSLSSIFFNRTTTSGSMAGTPTFKIYMMETASVDWGAGSLDWASAIGSATLVFDGNPASIVGSAAGWKEFSLIAPFAYSGSNNLAIFFEYKNTSASTSISWEYEYGTSCSNNSNTTKYNNNTTGTLASTLASTNLRRPVIGFNFVLPSCSVPPTAGVATTNNDSVCSGENFILDLTSNSVGDGQTYQWQQSTTGFAPWTDVGGADLETKDTLFQNTTTYYRCAVTCSGNTTYSDSVLVYTPTLVSGTFTINSLIPASSTNFTSFASAFDSIRCGINGPVTLNVVSGSGPYVFSSPLTINSIYGTSSSNTITINGNGKTVNYNATVSGDRSAFVLNGIDYLTINNLTIDVSSGSYGWGILLTNSADNNTINACTILTNTSATTTNYAGIVVSGSNTSATTNGNNGNGNTFSDNSIIGGYYGISIVGEATTLCSNNKVLNNIIDEFNYYGIYTGNQNNLEISGNNLQRLTRSTFSTTSYGINMVSVCTGSEVKNNRIHNLFAGALSNTSTIYGIYVSADGTTLAPNKIYNNLIYNLEGDGTHYGIYNSGGEYMQAYHNTIALDYVPATAGLTYGFYQTTNVNGIEFKNNIVYITRGGTGAKYGIYKATPATPLVSNNNVFYLGSAGSGAQSIGYLNTAQASLADWQLASSLDLVSSVADPVFTDPNTGDYSFTATSVDNLGDAVGVTTDILGNPRSLTTPDVGAYEYVTPVCIAPPTAGNVTSSVDTICANSGFTLNLVGNSIGLGQTYQWQKSTTGFAPWTDVDVADASSLKSTSQITSTYYRCAVTCSGNTVYSDSLQVFSPALVSGTFTIDKNMPASSSNFTSFESAFDSISCGINGPVVFNVVSGSGPYTLGSQIFINDIYGTSSTNTITINGNGETVNYGTATSALRSAFVLNGINYLIFDSLTLDVSADTYGVGIQFMNNSSNNIIRKCTILNTITSTSTNYSGIVFSSSLTSSTTAGANGSNNLIENNRIVGGYYSITACGLSAVSQDSNNIIRNNLLEDYYFYGVYLIYQNNGTVESNNIHRPLRTNSGSCYPIYSTTGNKGMFINANRIHNNFAGQTSSTSSFYGIYVTSDATPTNPNLISNNLIYNNEGNGTHYGLYNGGGDTALFYHNTVSLDYTPATAGLTYGIYMSSTANNGVEYKNNNIYITRGGTGAKYAFYDLSSNNYISNNNNFYLNSLGAGAQYVGYRSTVQTTLSDWQTATSNDMNSYVLNPMFYNPAPNGSIYLPTNSSLQNLGAALSITTDINGETRNLSTPDIGAYEMPAFYHYRSKATGNWGDLSTWDYSTDSLSWSAATTLPSYYALSTVVSNGNTVTINNAATIDKTFVNPTGILAVNDALTVYLNGLTLRSDASGTGALGQSSGSITGNVTVERYIPAKATRKWSLLSSPITQSVANSWQQQIHITGSGTGGTLCPTLSSHTNGFDATLTNASNMFTYNAAGTPGNRWTAVASTNADNLMAGKGFRVNVRGDRSLGCDLLNGVNMVPSAVTLSSTGTISNVYNNMGSFSITYPNVGVSNYVLIGNPYPSALSFSALQGANGASIGTNYAIYVPASLPGVYSYWDDNNAEFTGGTGYDESKGNTIASGQAVFVQSLVAGDVTLNFTETQKDTEGTAGYFRSNNTKDRVRISLNKDEKIDEVVIRYANDATVSNTTIGKKDIPSMNYGTYITSLKGTTHTAVQTRSLSTLSTDEVWLNIGATQSGNYSLSFSQYEDFAGSDIYLVDHLAKTTQNIKENATYVFSVDVNNAATKGSARFSLVFTKRSVEPTIVYNSIKMYPNPANTQVTLLLPQSADIRYQIKVTDMTGKVVMQSKAAGGTTQMNINRLTKGAYLVEVTDSKGNRTTEKLIKN